MSDAPAVQFHDLGKMYRLYTSRGDAVIDALGLTKLFPRRRITYREFWALRGIDLIVPQGQRLGIVGRNGAGKSTLLKLLTGNITPSHGTIEVNGRVQALLESGGGLHPEFSGYENIHAALTYQGLSPREIAKQVEDIEDFTELGEFLNQPLKTYSLGMQARLAFAIATTVKPEILIIDEVLGSGDAYFFTKSTERMTSLVGGGATVLLVTHALDQIARFCDVAIWLERGRIAARGPALEVIKRYEEYIRQLEDRRLRAKNLKVQSRRYGAMQQDLYAHTFVLRIGVERGRCDVSAIDLVRDGELEDSLSVGDAQDADPSQSAFVLVEGGWSRPEARSDECFRSLHHRGAPGSVLFHLWTLYTGATYACNFTFRAPDDASVTAEALVDGEVVAAKTVGGSGAWCDEAIVVEPRSSAAAAVSSGGAAKPALPSLVGESGDNAGRAVVSSVVAGDQASKVSRWPGLGSLLIDRVLLMDEHDREQAVFAASSPMKLQVTFRATRGGRFPIILTAVVYRVDGIRMFAHIDDPIDWALEQNESCTAVLDLGPLNLGDGRYVTTVALYKQLSVSGPSPFYDLLDRSYEFEVIGNPPFAGVFRHPGEWHVRDSAVRS